MSVVVTLGVGYAVVVTADSRTHLVQPELRGPYPVGSGDAFLAGRAVAFSRGGAVVDAARLGLAAGVAKAQIAGAGELDPHTVDGIVDQVTLDVI